MRIHCYLCVSLEVSAKLYCAAGLVVKLCFKCEEDRYWQEKVKQRCRGNLVPKNQIRKVISNERPTKD